jgi:hypothetical protein
VNGVNKVIATNASVLSAKYGQGISKVSAAVDELIAADRDRGLTTMLVNLDDASTMTDLGAPAVKNPSDPQQAKAAVDGVHSAVTPDYLLLLGAVDVIPHQPLKNPLFADGEDDPDQFAYGDLPYACEAPYSDEPGDFIGPTRVVGRLPDLTGGSDPAYLAGLLEVAADWQSHPIDDYLSYLGVSARVWQGSTRLSLSNLFGSATDLQLSPTEGPNWTAELLGRRSHFINCHGAPADPKFYGQEGSNYPVAHDAQVVTGNLAEGTVAAAECCYGAELYDPAASGGTTGLSSTYLGSGAYGFLGSSTIAYGPAEGNGAADLICQYFLRNVLAGASLGRATLQARQEFVREVSVVDPADMKTLAQFNLLGDPSIHPVEAGRDEHAVPAPEAATRPHTLPAGRTARRRNLLTNGVALLEATSVTRAAPQPPAEADVPADLRRLGEREGLADARVLSFTVDEPPLAKTMRAMGSRGPVAGEPLAVHVLLRRGQASEAPVPEIVALVAREEDGRIVSFRKLYGK